jgi:gamma-glutamylcyclotransferase (GGCT)/AIG2-like uncharacterized protein YtfP
MNFLKHTQYNDPHPFAVFGTLRKIPSNQGNARLMRGYTDHQKGFLPHFIAKGITLYFQKNATVPVEVFSYDPDYWKHVVSDLDRLERFTPNRPPGHYVRTLMNVKILPPEYKETIFEEGLVLSERNLNISYKKWDEFKNVQAWVYSSPKANLLAAKLENSPIVWPNI